MNSILLFISGLMLITCLYGLSLQYQVNWFLIIGTILSTAVITSLIGEK